MKVKITRDENRDLTILDVTGPVSKVEMHDALESLYKQKPTALLLWDMSEADVSRVETNDLKAFAQRSAQLGVSRKGGRTAIFAPSDLHYGLARMAEAFAEINSAPFMFQVFRSRQQALEWLMAKNTS